MGILAEIGIAVIGVASEAAIEVLKEMAEDD